MKSFIAAGLLATLVSGCASLASRTHGLCAPLREFVASVEPGEKRAIDHHTVWGTGFRGNPEPAFYEVECIHGNYGPAKPLCEHLVEQGSIEFSNRNAEDAISCLAPDMRFSPDVELGSGKFFVMPRLRGHWRSVTLSLEKDPERGGEVLRIEVVAR